MATLGAVRTRVRVWLEDTAGAPLWSDGEIDEGLRLEMDRYSRWSPRQVEQDYAVAGGEKRIPLGVDVLAVVRVVDPSGFVLPRRSAAARDTGDEEQAWELWGNTLSLSRPAVAGTYTVWYEGYHAFPSAEGEAFPVPEGDLSLLVAGAVVWCLEERAREEWKRGALPPRYEQRLHAARQDYQDLLDTFRRRVRVSVAL